ncbi:MAG TPA: hypothetical protein V6C91_14780 [Coleofasciculaceae cyanobacterium]
MDEVLAKDLQSNHTQLDLKFLQTKENVMTRYDYIVIGVGSASD